MTEHERDERVTQAYRALGEESPPAALDAAILAASRRRGGRWYVPVASAAALVLAVAVAVVVEREAPKESDEARVALVERGYLGGDCLVTGCVPSKGLIRAAAAAREARTAGRFGVRCEFAGTDFAEAMTWVRSRRSRIAPHDSVERCASAGVDVFLGSGRFVGPREIEVGGSRLRFRRAVIATGARPKVPPIDGLDDAGYLTTETVFSLTKRPSRLIVIGGGPIGCELAQAFQRLGSEVTLITDDRLLPRDDPQAGELVAKQFRAEGIRVVTGARGLACTPLLRAELGPVPECPRKGACITILERLGDLGYGKPGIVQKLPRQLESRVIDELLQGRPFRLESSPKRSLGYRKPARYRCGRQDAIEYHLRQHALNLIGKVKRAISLRFPKSLGHKAMERGISPGYGTPEPGGGKSDSGHRRVEDNARPERSEIRCGALGLSVRKLDVQRLPRRPA